MRGAKNHVALLVTGVAGKKPIHECKLMIRKVWQIKVVIAIWH